MSFRAISTGEGPTINVERENTIRVKGLTDALSTPDDDNAWAKEHQSKDNLV
jgi:hypothetical protein